MELRPGFKNSEVGAIPIEWECMTVADVASHVRNAIVGGPFGSDLVSADYVDEGVPVIRGQNMGQRWVEGPYAFVAEEKASALSANLARPGDVVFTQRGTLGQVALVPPAPYSAYLVSQSQMKVTLNPQLVDAGYFHALFTGDGHQRLIQTSTIQTGVPHINLGVLRSIPLQVPPLAEQRAIAAALGDVDALLVSLDQLIAKKRDLKLGSMQQLLTGRTRLPGFNGKWETVRAGDIGRFRGGNAFPVRFQGGVVDDYPFFKVSDMNNVGNEHQMVVANNWISEAVKRQLGATAFPAGSIVFAKVGAAVFLERKKLLTRPSCLDNNLAAFVLDPSRANEHFLLYVLLATSLGNLVSTTALPSLSGKVLAALQLNLPPLPEQAAIAEVLADIDAEISALDAHRDKTRAIKQGVMQELLTGRTRLV